MPRQWCWGLKHRGPSSHPSCPRRSVLGWFGSRRRVTHTKVVGGGRLCEVSGSPESPVLRSGVSPVRSPGRPSATTPQKERLPTGHERALPGDTVLDVVEQTLRHQGVFVQVHQVRSLRGRGWSGEGPWGGAARREGGSSANVLAGSLAACRTPHPPRESSAPSCSHSPQLLQGSLTRPLLTHKIPPAQAP